MKRRNNFLKKSVFILVFSLVVVCQPLPCFAENEYIITESQLLKLEQNNLTVQNELEELKKQQKTQEEFSKRLEEENENLQKEIEKEKKTRQTLINIIPIAFIIGAAAGGVCMGLALK